RYGIYLPLEQLRTKAQVKLIITAQTTISSVTVSNSINVQKSPIAAKEFVVRKMDLLNLD
ncbi:MAG: hypothetical protein J6P60_04470, partial [Lachnospiraceae bacterium]|nr:hypothetical protein [Lachnospiraceae bacterium]